MGLVKPHIALIGMRTTINNKMSTQTTTPLTIETYHRLKSYHPKSTTHDRLYNLPHICTSKYWRDSPHLGHKCNNCDEVEKIIRMEDHLEEKFHIRQYSLFNCTCHWCRNRRRLSHQGCRLCDEDAVEEVEDGIIYLSDEDEEEINNSPQLDEKRVEEEDVEDLPLDGKRGWTPPRHPLKEDYPGFYYDDSVEEYLSLIS